MKKYVRDHNCRVYTLSVPVFMSIGTDACVYVYRDKRSV